MAHDWHDDTISACVYHARQFADSCRKVLQGGDTINLNMQKALATDLRDVVEDLNRIDKLFREEPPARPRDAYVQRLEGVVFVQLHQIQQLQKEVARHASPA